MLAATNISEKTQLAKFAKYNSTPKFVDLQYAMKDNIVCASAQMIFHFDVPRVGKDVPRNAHTGEWH